MKNKRGLSAIIITVILIALALVAIGIIWAVVNSFIQKNKTSIEIEQKCSGTQINIISTQCYRNLSESDPIENCTISLSRGGSESSDLGGIKVVFFNDTITSNAEEFGKLSQLGKATKSNIQTNIINVSGVKVVPYFLDDSNSPYNCYPVESKTIIQNNI